MVLGDFVAVSDGDDVILCDVEEVMVIVGVGEGVVVWDADVDIVKLLESLIVEEGVIEGVCDGDDVREGLGVCVVVGVYELLFNIVHVFVEENVSDGEAVNVSVVEQDGEHVGVTLLVWEGVNDGDTEWVCV